MLFKRNLITQHCQVIKHNVVFSKLHINWFPQHVPSILAIMLNSKKKKKTIDYNDMNMFKYDLFDLYFFTLLGWIFRNIQNYINRHTSIKLFN